LHLAGIEPGHPRHRPRPDRKPFGTAVLIEPQDRRRTGSWPIDWPGERNAIPITAETFDDENLRSRKDRFEPPVRRGIRSVRSLDLAQHAMQGGPIGGNQIKGAGNLPSPDRCSTFATKGEQFFPRWKTASVAQWIIGNAQPLLRRSSRLR